VKKHMADVVAGLYREFSGAALKPDKKEHI
jgi:hypothetical protein